jgi:hypothetical protein
MHLYENDELDNNCNLFDKLETNDVLDATHGRADTSNSPETDLVSSHDHLRFDTIAEPCADAHDRYLRIHTRDDEF